MFTGIIETQATVQQVAAEGTNQRFTLQSSLAKELHVDQSVAHDGVCLTVERVAPDASQYEVVAIAETLKRSALGQWAPGRLVNLERCLRADARLDGHFVQGHVDATGAVIEREELNGSWHFAFRYPEAYQHLIVPKGSICINGVSLTVVDDESGRFSVAIIPYTYQHTGFAQLKIGDAVNLEFDVLGKYVAKIQGLQPTKS